MDATPYGALDYDTSEVMIGSVTATVVLLESNGAVDANLENWSPAAIQAAKDNVVEALAWWEDVFAAQNSVHELNFHIDFTFADQPAATAYEPIARSSLDYVLWVDEFLDQQGVAPSEPLNDRSRLFNHAQREAHQTNWSFTIFVINDTADADGWFAGGGALGGFAVPNAGFIVIPARRPVSTIAHETAHMFWAVDEYNGGRSYYDSRGYYNTQNTNGREDHPLPTSREVSIMDDHEVAFPLEAISQSAREMIGWKDSDGDGIFDIADVPLTLSGNGAFDDLTDSYRFVGSSHVNTLRNLNPSGRQSDLTLNQVSRLQVRFDGGAWNDVVEIHAYDASIDVEFAVPLGVTSFQLRTIDDATGITSNLFQGSTSQPSSTVDATVQGFVWFDDNRNGVFDHDEVADVGAVVQLLDASAMPLAAPQVISAASFTAGTTISTLPSGIELQAVTTAPPAASLSVLDLAGAQVFAHKVGAGAWNSLWTSTSPKLQVTLPTEASFLSVKLTGGASSGYGRITAYNAAHQLLLRVNSDALSAAEVEWLSIASDNADIAYIVVEGRGPGGILIDAVQIGASNTATVNEMGAFAIEHILPGTYKVAATSSDAEQSAAMRQVFVNPSTRLANVNFALTVAPSWRNVDLPGDVDEDGFENTLDLAYMVAELKVVGSRSLEELPPIHGHLVDLDGDGLLTTLDLALLVKRLHDRLNLVATPQPDEDDEEHVDAEIVSAAVVSESPSYSESPEYEAEFFAAAVVQGLQGRSVSGGGQPTSEVSPVAMPLTATRNLAAWQSFLLAIEDLVPRRRLERLEMHDACFQDRAAWLSWDEVAWVADDDVVAPPIAVDSLSENP